MSRLLANRERFSPLRFLICIQSQQSRFLFRLHSGVQFELHCEWQSCNSYDLLAGGNRGRPRNFAKKPNSCFFARLHARSRHRLYRDTAEFKERMHSLRSVLYPSRSINIVAMMPTKRDHFANRER